MFLSASAPLSHGGKSLPGPHQVVATAWRHRSLVLRLARREIEARYRGSLLGFAWSLIVPMILLAVYTYVFSMIFQARWSTRATRTGDFAVVLWSGLVLFNFLAEVVNRAPSLLLQSTDYIKRVVFPLEILVWVAVASAGFNALVGIVVLFAGHAALIGVPPITALCFPLMLLPLALLAAGAGWLLSSLGVFVRDLQQVVPVLVSVLMMVTPIFYPREAIPPRFAVLAAWNPLALVVEQGRAVLFGATWPSWPTFAVLLVVGWTTAWVGLLWFARTRKAFADVV